MTARHDKTIVQTPAERAHMSETQATQANLAGTPSTGSGGGEPTVPMTPPTIPDVQIEGEIGRGGMGVVYRGRQPYLDRRVAVKLLLLQKGSGSEDYVKRFQREAKILAGLSHPHIVACYQAGVTADANPYLVMEFIDGPNLRDYVAKNGPLAPEQGIAVIRDLARALEHANSCGIIHRDVKPENVLLATREKTAPGEFPWVVKLVDLGLARPSAKDGSGGGEMHLTMQGVLMGTPATMAPEQFDDPEHVDFRADIYGLGCVLYHALTGSPAFSSRTLGEILSLKVSGIVPNPQSQRQSLPRGVCDLVGIMLARDKTHRPQSYQDLIARCDAIAADPNRAQRGAAKPSKTPLVIGVVGAAALIAVAAFALTRPSTKASPTPSTAAATTGTTAPAGATAVEGPAATVAFGDAQPLFGTAHTTMLEGWTPLEGGQFAPSEESLDAVSGSAGVLTHPITAPPWKVEGVLRPGSSLAMSVGAAIADGRAYALSVKSLGTTSSISIDAGTRDKPYGAPQRTGTTPSTKEMPFSITVIGKTMAVEVAGIELPPVPIAGAPIELLLYVQGGGDSPGEFGKMTIRYRK